MSLFPTGPPDELPSLRATMRLDDKVEGSDVAVSFYDVKFYPYTEPGVDPVFALVGANTVWICRPKNDSRTAIEVLRCFRDEDQDLDSREHQLNSVCWAKDAQTGSPLVIVSNDERAIKILNVRTGKPVRTLTGHGSAVNDLVVCPTDPNILASCSMDYTIRIWNLSPAFASQPCVAICAGEGHREGLLGIAWHRSGRYLLSGGHDTVVCLWAIPDLPKEPSDHVVKIFYPHFASNEVHWNYVDCLQWYGDLILSRAVGEPASSRTSTKATGSIFLWQIDGFEPDKYPGSGDGSKQLPPAPGPSVYKPSFTRSAFGKGITRLLTFELKFSSLFYMRFGLFHQPGLRPILCAGNERSKVHFWDLQQLEEGGPPLPAQNQRWAGHHKKFTAFVSETASANGDGGVVMQLDDDEDDDTASIDTSMPGRDSTRFRRSIARSGKLQPHQRLHHRDSTEALSSHRDSSVASDLGSHVTESTTSYARDMLGAGMLRPVGRGKAGRTSKEDLRLRYMVDDPFRELQPHKAVVVPRVGFCVRQIGWSVGGEWCVACGDNGMVALFSRWLKDES